MANQHKEELKNEVFTIPNILSMLRILLIFAVVVLFFLKYYLISGIVLIVSGVTDVLDGFIARKFNMISPLGKALDPFADKLTQFAILICLIQFSLWVIVPFGILLVRDAFMLASGISIFKKTHETFSAKWYGKVATAYTFAFMCSILVFWYQYADAMWLFYVLLGLDSGLILFSFIMYFIRNTRELKKLDAQEISNNSNKEEK